MSLAGTMPVPQSLRGDIRGAIAAAMTALSVEIVYGLFAVAPLGAAFAEHGIRAALWGCILGGILGFFLRGTGGMFVGTRPATALVLGTLASTLLHHPDVAAAADPAAHAFTLLLLCTALAGLFQYLFGFLQVGRALRYAPFPVTAGLMLGVATLMILGSLRPALGATNDAGWMDLLQAWHPASLIVAAVALVICFAAQRFRTRIPGSVVALLVGSLVHHGLVVLLGSEQLGGTSIALVGVLPEYSTGSAGIDLPELVGWLPVLTPYALTIAVFGVLETLLCLSAIGNATSIRPDGNKELRVQGLANLVAGLLGATSSTGNLARVSISLSLGGRGRLAGLFYAATLALAVLLAGSFLSLVPHAVTAAIVIYYAIGMVDDGTRRMTQQLIVLRRQLRRQYYRVLLSNFLVIVLVAMVAVIGDMVKAAGVGFAAAMFLYVRSRPMPAIRRVSHCDRRRSLKVRTADDMALLDREGERIVIIEADGPLFFGTADSVAEEIEKVSARSSWVIVDFRRIHDIDPTGARTLLQTSRRLLAQGKQMIICGVPPMFAQFLKAMGLGSVIPAGNWHHDLDSALEDAEDRLLTQRGGHAGHQALPLAETALAAGLCPGDCATLERFLIRHDYASRTQLFSMGDEGDSLFVASGSSVDIRVPLPDGKHKRIVCLAPGVIFGELALLEGKPRSTDAILLEPGVVWQLSRNGLDALLAAHPLVARQVLFNVGRQLAGRLRLLTSEITMLESD